MIERKIFNKKWKLEMHFLLVKEEVVLQIKEVPISKYLKIIINNKYINNSQFINSNLNILTNNRTSNNPYNKFNINKAL